MYISSNNNLPSALFDLYSNYDPYEYNDSREKYIVQKKNWLI